MSMVDDIKKKAQSKLMTIVLPEGDEPRTVQAAKIIKDEGLAKPVLIGKKDAVENTAKETDTDITGIEIIDPENSPKSAEYAKELFELRKAKGVTEEDAAKLVKDVMYYAISKEVKDCLLFGILKYSLSNSNILLFNFM